MRDEENLLPAAQSAAVTLDKESSLQLLDRVRAGDHVALDCLLARYLPRLMRWAAGRLPRWARDITDTQDLVQETLLRSFNKIEAFEPTSEGALQAYLREAIRNRIRDELRRAERRPAASPLDSGVPDSVASPLEEFVGQEALERYEKALDRLRPEDRELVIARIEMDCTNEEIASAQGKPSANAARMAVERALLRLAREMRKLEE